MDRTTIARWLLAAFIFANGCDIAGSQCWDFNTGFSSWNNQNPPPNLLNWKSSVVDGDADKTSIPSFYSTSPYIYYQDQATPPVSGTILSSNVILNAGDTVSMTVFRHIIDTHLNDSSRPQLRFVSGTVSRNIEFDYFYDKWDTVTTICDYVSVPGVRSICCTAYPCPGQFYLDGVVYVRDELIAVDSVEVNSGCSSPTVAPPTAGPPTVPPTTPPPTAPPTTPPPTAPPTTPPPSGCTCDFSASTLCYWSAASISTGWHWTGYYPYPITSGSIPPSPNGQFLWVGDTTSLLYSPLVTDVTSLTTVSFYYYFDTDNPAGNALTFSFKNSLTGTTTTLFSTSIPTGGWPYISLGVSCGAGPSPCQGTIQVESYNTVGDILWAGIDLFTISGARC